MLKQQQIGWSGLLIGLITTSCRTAKTALQKTFSIQSKLSPTKWAAHTVSILLKFRNEIWIDRNQLIHDKDTQNLSLNESADAQINTYFSQKETFPYNSFLFSSPLDDILTLPTYKNINWISDAKLEQILFKKSLTSILTSQKVISDFFPVL